MQSQACLTEQAKLWEDYFANIIGYNYKLPF